jgi:hypothetical protein
MSATDAIYRILSGTALTGYGGFRYCYMDENKEAYNGKVLARSDVRSDFVPLDGLDLSLSDGYAGVGISVQASGVSAVDVDHCFSVPFDLSSADARGKSILSIFEGCYEEFSFSGTGLRCFFLSDPIPDYTKIYFIKNKKTGCEFYYPEGSNRYISVTGRTIQDNAIKQVQEGTLLSYLDKYLKRPELSHSQDETSIIEGVDPEQLLMHYIRSDSGFQNNWFDKAPGSGSNESERDYFLVAFIYDHITRDKAKIKAIFERSPFFLSKDRKHVSKWEYRDGRYYDYIYECVSGQR